MLGSKDLQLRRQGTGQVESVTGTNWMDRTNKENDTLLPDINDNDRGSKRRAAGGMMGGGVSKAAGFKSDFNNTGNYSQTNGGVRGYDFGATNGLGQGLIPPRKDSVNNS
jgi:hypothetical protein